jgi:hypothetical protein
VAVAVAGMTQVAVVAVVGSLITFFKLLVVSHTQ